MVDHQTTNCVFLLPSSSSSMVALLLSLSLYCAISPGVVLVDDLGVETAWLLLLLHHHQPPGNRGSTKNEF